jgi:two-component system response regulator PilR (NtrC family)
MPAPRRHHRAESRLRTDARRYSRDKALRRDLYFRLNVVSLRIPALRERRPDIPLLITHFIERMVRNSGREKVVSDEALKALLACDRPGMVRKLENCRERTYAFTRGPLIHPTDLPPEIAKVPGHRTEQPQWA